MKFFLISNMYPTRESPGYGSFVKNVCDGLRNNGHVIKCKSVIKGKAKNKFNKVIKYLFFYLSIIINYFRNYDSIYIHFPNQTIPLLYFLHYFKQPNVIINFHGEDLIYSESGYTKILGKLTEKYCKEYAKVIIVPSVYFKNIVLSRNLKKTEDVIVSPSGGINKDYFYPLVKENNNTIPILHIGYVGRLEPDKGIYEFLETCRRLHKNIPFKATIIGYGSCYDYIISFIEENKLVKEIQIIKGIPQSELGFYYRQLDLLIFCSSRTGESLGLTGIEAMACGIPVIGTNIGGIATYLKHKVNGWLVEVKNVDQIVASIYEYIKMPYLEKQDLFKACIKTGENYYSGKVCEELSFNLENCIYAKHNNI